MPVFMLSVEIHFCLANIPTKNKWTTSQENILKNVGRKYRNSPAPPRSPPDSKSI